MGRKLSSDTNRYRDRVIIAHRMLGNKCSHCGLLKSKAKDKKFEIDHINPEEKSYTVTDMLKSLPWEELEIEIEKCQLLCGECHKKKTFPHMGKHGMTRMYRKGCRCDECKTAVREYQRKHREKKRGKILEQSK